MGLFFGCDRDGRRVRRIAGKPQVVRLEVTRFERLQSEGSKSIQISPKKHDLQIDRSSGHPH